MSINIIHIINGTEWKFNPNLDLNLGLGPQSQKTHNWQHPDSEHSLQHLMRSEVRGKTRVFLGLSRGGLLTSSYQTMVPPSSDKSVFEWLRNTVILSFLPQPTCVVSWKDTFLAKFQHPELRRPRSGAQLLFLCCEGNASCSPPWARRDNLP